MDNKDNINNNNNNKSVKNKDKKYKEEFVKLVEDAARRGANQAKKGTVVWKVIPIVLIILLIVGAGFYIKYMFNSGINEIKSQFSIENGAESHDLVLNNSGIFGYTAADFYDAILGDTKQLKKLEVYEAKISDATKITNTGIANLAIFTKTQLVTFNGTAKYTVDLSKINRDSISVDKIHKTVKLVIPHAEMEEINIPSSEMEFGDTEHGWLAFGEVSLSPEENAKLESGARERMEHKLIELNEQEKADRFAKMSVWDIFQPMISSVSANYKLEVAFE